MNIATTVTTVDISRELSRARTRSGVSAWTRLSMVNVLEANEIAKTLAFVLKLLRKRMAMGTNMATAPIARMMPTVQLRTLFMVLTLQVAAPGEPQLDERDHEEDDEHDDGERGSVAHLQAL